MTRMTRTVVAAGTCGVVAAFGAPAVSPAGATTAPRVSAVNCRPAQLRVSVGRPSGAAGTIYYPIVFTDLGGACWIWGVAQVQPVVGAKHHPQGPPATNASVGELPARHQLVHGGAVSDGYGVAESGNYPPARCRARNAGGVIVSLAPFIRPTFLALRISVCTRVASTHTQLLVAGRTGA